MRNVIKCRNRFTFNGKWNGICKQVWCGTLEQTQNTSANCFSVNNSDFFFFLNAILQLPIQLCTHRLNWVLRMMGKIHFKCRCNFMTQTSSLYKISQNMIWFYNLCTQNFSNIINSTFVCELDTYLVKFLKQSNVFWVVIEISALVFSIFQPEIFEGARCI